MVPDARSRGQRHDRRDDLPDPLRCRCAGRRPRGIYLCVDPRRGDRSVRRVGGLPGRRQQPRLHAERPSARNRLRRLCFRRPADGPCAKSGRLLPDRKGLRQSRPGEICGMGGTSGCSGPSGRLLLCRPLLRRRARRPQLYGLLQRRQTQRNVVGVSAARLL